MKKNYRLDIDALRGISVLSVVLYHSKLQFFNYDFFSGGFLGVDIFFVITGYLISKILLNEYYLTNNINFADFYKRRVRRLIPTLVVILMASTLLSYFVLDPAKLKQFSASVYASIIFTANAYFHYFGNFYGNDDNLFKPLLHLWSLGVEEQFYILFPIILLLILKFFKNFIIFFFLLGFILSLIFAEYASTNHIMFSFYMLPSRIWEILLGSVIAYYTIFNKTELKINIFIKNLLYLISILIIFSCFFIFDINLIKHPSIITLLPLLACSIIIILGSEKKKIYLYDLFSNRFFVFFGKISYSLYLWHFLFFSIFRNSFLEEGLFAKIFIIFLSIIVSIWSYKYVEQKYRSKKISFKSTIRFSLILTFLISFINLYYLSSEKILKKFEIDNVYLTQWKDTNFILDFIRKNNHKKYKDNNKVKVLIVGNCHADDTYIAFKFAQKNFSKYEFILHPRLEVADFKNKVNKKTNLYQTSDIIIFSSRWREEDISILSNLILNIKKDNKQIIVFNSIPEFNFTEEKFGLKKIFLTNYKKQIIKSNSVNLSLKDETDLKKLYYNQFSNRSDTNKINNDLFKIASFHKVKIINSFEFFCEEFTKECEFRSKENYDELYRDYGRYSITGLKILAQKFSKPDILNAYSNF